MAQSETQLTQKQRASQLWVTHISVSVMRPGELAHTGIRSSVQRVGLAWKLRNARRAGKLSREEEAELAAMSAKDQNLFRNRFRTLLRNYSEIIPNVFRNDSEIVQKSFRNCSEIVPKSFRNCSEIIPTLFRNCSEMNPTRHSADPFAQVSALIRSHRLSPTLQIPHRSRHTN